jgi:hypothetical protein
LEPCNRRELSRSDGPETGSQLRRLNASSIPSHTARLYAVSIRSPALTSPPKGGRQLLRGSARGDNLDIGARLQSRDDIAAKEACGTGDKAGDRAIGHLRGPSASSLMDGSTTIRGRRYSSAANRRPSGQNLTTNSCHIVQCPGGKVRSRGGWSSSARLWWRAHRRILQGRTRRPADVSVQVCDVALEGELGHCIVTSA